jgi:hypothetical protein
MTTARDIIEACAICGGSAAMAGKSYVEVADDIRALADQYGDAVLCEPEPVAYQYSVQPQVLGDCYFAFSERQDTPDAKPLYRAKEPK